MQQIASIEKNQNQANRKRPRHVDQARGQWKAAVVLLGHRKRHKVAGERPGPASAKHQNAACQQSTILARWDPEALSWTPGASCRKIKSADMTALKNEDLAPPAAYPREDVRRMLNVSERQLRSWEKQGFVQAAEAFSFSDLLALKTLKKLREFEIAPRQIQLAIASLRKRLTDIDHPLAQLRITAEGRRIAVHVSGQRMEPISGQLLFDFDAKEIEKLRAFPTASSVAAAATDASHAQESEFWFQRGLSLEEAGAPVGEAVAAYRKAIELNPQAPGALVNLGTIAFRMRKMKEAEEFYTRAMEADPHYPLAHFNLGNLHDDQGRVQDAHKYYLSAIHLNPRYADAYFNLALLCERNNEVLQAIAHWQTYLKLDSTSSWARAARKQLDRLKRTVRAK
jgi:tetratricopeptide (TPR) repeat protein